jgi:1-acyl-sn-glycerol-3-phosphate acyltransferase
MLLALRILLIIAWLTLSGIYGVIISFIRPFNPDNVRIGARAVAWGRNLLGIKFILRNREIFAKNHPSIIVSNHQDNMDIFFGGATIPRRTVSIGKKSIIWIPFFGLYYWLSGNILIDRKNKKSAFETMDLAAKKLRENDISVWIMPEGTRSKGRGLLPFKKGPFITAIKAGVPVIPVAVSSYIKDTNLNRWRSATMIVEVLPPVSTEGLTVTDATMLKEKVYLLMKEAIDRLDNEVALGKL